MLLSTFFLHRKALLFLLLGLGLSVGALEAAFIFLVKSFGNGPSRDAHWMTLLLWMGLLVTARTVIQFMATHFEMRAVFSFLADKRKALLQATIDRSVPAHRAPWRGDLAYVWNDGLENLGQGIMAGFRCLAAATQALALLPMLFLFSWKLATGALLLAIPALLASRLRTGMLLAAGKGWERSQAELAVTIEDFSDGFEAHVGNGRYAAAAFALDKGLAQHAEKTHSWETAKAIFPPALEWFFFMALAGLAVVLAKYGDASVQGVSGLLPFGALLLLIYRPIREWARHYPASVLGGQAWRSLSKRTATLLEYPVRKAFQVASGEKILLSGIRFGYTSSPDEVLNRRVFDGLDLELDPNSVTWISGRNGSGKSTLLKLLAGVETAQAGVIEIPAVLAAWPRPIAYLSQKAVVEPDWLEWQRNFQVTDSAAWIALDSILGLDRILSRAKSLRGLSGGERQRLCLARTFAAPCCYLLLDEPTTWLSAEDRESILGDLLSFWRTFPVGTTRPKSVPGSRGAAIVSHEPFIAEFCTHIVRMDTETKVLLQETPLQVVEKEKRI